MSIPNFPLHIQSANVNVSTNAITSTGHGMLNTQPVYIELENPGTYPTPLAGDVTYFVVGATTDTFQLALTSGGAAIDITAQGSGGFDMFASSVPVTPASGSAPSTPAPDLASEVAMAGRFPLRHFDKRERKLLQSVKTYADSISADTVITTEGDLIIGSSTGTAVRLPKGTSGLPLVAGASTDSYVALGATGLAAGAVTLAKLDSGVAPSHVVKFAGKYITLGGSATEAQTLAGVAATDIVIATMQDATGTPRTLLTSKPTTNTITYIFSGDPSTTHTVSYTVYRAAT